MEVNGYTIAPYADLAEANLREVNLAEANLREVNLVEADLRGAKLVEANLRGADLRGADLEGAHLHEAHLRWAELQGADLRGADLRGADLHEAHLRWADLLRARLKSSIGNDIIVKHLVYFDNLYKYQCGFIIDQYSNQWIKMGCFIRLRSDWDKDFWNNDQEFPNDGSFKSKQRKLAYEHVCAQLDLFLGESE